jgi:hypothetical protein
MWNPSWGEIENVAYMPEKKRGNWLEMMLETLEQTLLQGCLRFEMRFPSIYLPGVSCSWNYWYRKGGPD